MNILCYWKDDVLTFLWLIFTIMGIENVCSICRPISFIYITITTSKSICPCVCPCPHPTSWNQKMLLINVVTYASVITKMQSKSTPTPPRTLRNHLSVVPHRLDFPYFTFTEKLSGGNKKKHRINFCFEFILKEKKWKLSEVFFAL